MLSGLGPVLRRRPGLLIGGMFIAGALFAETATAPLWSDHPPDWLAFGSISVAILSSVAAVLLFVGALRPAIRRGGYHPMLVACVALLLGTGAVTARASHVDANPVRQTASRPDSTESTVDVVVHGVGLKGDDAWILPVIARSVDGVRAGGRIEAVLPIDRTGETPPLPGTRLTLTGDCLLYTSDAADE